MNQGTDSSAEKGPLRALGRGGRAGEGTARRGLPRDLPGARIPGESGRHSSRRSTSGRGGPGHRREPATRVYTLSLPTRDTPERVFSEAARRTNCFGGRCAPTRHHPATRAPEPALPHGPGGPTAAGQRAPRSLTPRTPPAVLGPTAQEDCPHRAAGTGRTPEARLRSSAPARAPRRAPRLLRRAPPRAAATRPVTQARLCGSARIDAFLQPLAATPPGWGGSVCRNLVTQNNEFLAARIRSGTARRCDASQGPGPTPRPDSASGVRGPRPQPRRR